MKWDEFKQSERLLKKAARILGVPVKDVPRVVKNLLDEVNELDAKIKLLEG